MLSEVMNQHQRHLQDLPMQQVVSGNQIQQTMEGKKWRQLDSSTETTTKHYAASHCSWHKSVIQNERTRNDTYQVAAMSSLTKTVACTHISQAYTNSLINLIMFYHSFSS